MTKAAAPAGPHSAIELLRSQSLTSLVQQELERRILAGGILPGDKLVEQDVATELNVSRGPVREAFRALEQAGLVVTEKNRGVFVRKISLQEADEIYEVRAGLDEMIGRLAAERAGEADIAELKTLVEQMRLAGKGKDVGAYYPHRVTYHPTCHSLRVLHVGDAPLRLLRAVRGIDLVELPNAEQCCGFGGTFAIKNADTSMAMLSDKLRCVLDTRAEVCAAADNSCLMQIGGALHRQRSGVRPVHLAEILASTE